MEASATGIKLGTGEVANQAAEFVEHLVQAAGMDIEVRTAVEGPNICFELDGKDRGLLLTDNARLLYAINHLTNQIYFRKSEDACSFVFDSRGYRASRAADH